MDVGLFLAFFLLLFHLLPLSSLSPSPCPANFSCENLELMNSKFPYTNGSLTYCDLCTVECEAKLPPKFALPPATHWFDVMSINKSTVKLRDPQFQSLLDGETCESFEHDIGLPDSHYIQDTILQTITLFRCNITNSEPSHALTEAFSWFKNYNKCNHHPGFTIYYQNPPYHDPSPSIEGLNCIPLNFPLAFRDNYPETIELFQLLTADFDIEWHVFDDCYECHREGYMCETEWKEKSGCAPTNAPKGTKKDTVIIVGTATPVAGLVILVILAYCFRRKFSFSEFCSRTEKFKIVEAFLKNYGSLAPKRYHYSDIKKMTNSFKTKLGQGGYGCVYKGKLHDGSPTAVKVLKESKGSGEEFINEVASISRTSHVNIVTLLGFCFQGRKRALVYEFMPNGSLDKFIYGGTSSTGRQLEFQSLYKIAVGIARGLEYLHRGCNTRIVHLDIKPHNILLDENFCPKISDFGLAKLCTGKESIVSILGTRGTFGYIAPEVCCKSLGGVSHKSDVYSYGMMIFEMAGGRKNIQVEVDHSSEIYFPDWIYRRIDKGDNLGLEIMNEEDNELARKMIIVSLWCIQTDPSSRPSISKVLEMLEGSLQALQIPPKPVLSYPSRASEEFSTVNIS